MNFADLTHQELDQHVMERLVLESDAISPILKGHILIEKILETLISAHLHNPTAFFRTNRSFDLKADLAYAMVLIDHKHFSAFKSINNYAHKHDYALQLGEVKSFKFDWAEIQNQAFKVACEKGVEEAARLATLFLCWKAMLLIKTPT